MSVSDVMRKIKTGEILKNPKSCVEYGYKMGLLSRKPMLINKPVPQKGGAYKSGYVLDKILEMAKKKPEITCEDFENIFSHGYIVSRLATACATGDLICITRGKSGRFGSIHAVYKLNPERHERK